MKSLVSLYALTALGVTFGVYACSATSSPIDIDPGANGGSANGSSSSSSQGSSTAVGNGGSVNVGSTSSGNKGGNTGVIFGSTTTADLDAGCGTADQPAELTPIYMIFLYDKSGSMGDDPNGQWKNYASRWEPLMQGMSDFFQASAAQAGTIGIQASLTFFPHAGNKQQTCQYDYSFPDVSMTPLQSAQSLVTALQTTTPGGGTPTLPAVIGGVNYAKKLMAKNTGAKAVVVLVTDGEPAIYNGSAVETDCAPSGSPLTNTIPDIVTVVNAAYKGDPQILTYVIGIGEATSAMNQIADAGGTESMIQLASNDAAAARAKLTESLSSIRTKQFNCSMPVPKDKFVSDLFNVYFKHSNGTLELIKKSQDCAGPGWYFEPASNPTKFTLCPSACNAIQQDLNGQLTYQQGCKTLLI